MTHSSWWGWALSSSHKFLTDKRHLLKTHRPSLQLTQTPVPRLTLGCKHHEALPRSWVPQTTCLQLSCPHTSWKRGTRQLDSTDLLPFYKRSCKKSQESQSMIEIAQQGRTQRLCLCPGEDALPHSHAFFTPLIVAAAGSFPALPQSIHPSTTRLQGKSFPQCIHCNPSSSRASNTSSRAKATPPLPETICTGKQVALWPCQPWAQRGHPLNHTPGKQQWRLSSQSLHYTRS